MEIAVCGQSLFQSGINAVSSSAIGWLTWGVLLGELALVYYLWLG